MNKEKILAVLLAGLMAVSSAVGASAAKDSDTEKGSSVSETQKKTDTDNKSEKDNSKNDDEEDNLPELHTSYYMLADLDSGRVLYSKNADEKVYPASTTKILTGIMALERCNLSDVVTATSEAIDPINNKHSNMGIRVGEELTVEQLLYGMLVHSANDAANVLAVHMAGNLSDFASLMNTRASELGAENTHFTNAHGFHDDNHYTTVADLAKITSYAMKNEKFAEIVSTSKYQIPATNKYHETRYLSSTNMFLSNNRTSAHLFKYALGVKTGSTDEAGNCLVAAAEKNGTRLMSIVMKCKNVNNGDGAYSFVDSRALLDYGFENYKHITVASLADVVADSKVREAKGGVRVTLSPEEELKVLLPKDTDTNQITAEIEMEEDIKAPIAKGDILGTAVYSLNGEELGTVKLIAGNDVERDLLMHIFCTIWDIITDPIVIIALLVIIFTIIYVKRRRNRRRKLRRRQLRRFQEENDDDYYDM